jgi:hypothetical protein
MFNWYCPIDECSICEYLIRECFIGECFIGEFLIDECSIGEYLIGEYKQYYCNQGEVLVIPPFPLVKPPYLWQRFSALLSICGSDR